MSDKRTGKKKKKIRPKATETPASTLQSPVNAPKRTNTPPQK